VIFGVDRLRQYFVLDEIALKNPIMADGSSPDSDIQRSIESINQRRANEKNWFKRELNPEEYPFKVNEFSEYLDSIVSDSPAPVTYHFRVGDGQIMGLTYPKRLEDAVDTALRVMKNRSEQAASSNR
jgi:hypothetical protein